MSAQVSARLRTPMVSPLTAKALPRVMGPAYCTRPGRFPGRQAARHGASTIRGVLHGDVRRRRPGQCGGKAAIAVRAASTAAQDLHMHGQFSSDGPAPDPASQPRPQTSWLPSAADLKRLWAPALVLIVMTGTFDARGLAYLVASVNLYLLLFFAGLPILHQPVDDATTWIWTATYTICALMFAGLYALTFCDQGLAKVVLVKSWFRVAIGLPLRLYNGINTPSGAILTGCMRGLMSWTGKLLLARAALKAFFDFKAARSNAAAAPTASHEVETAKHLMLTDEGSLLAGSSEESPLQALKADSGLRSRRTPGHEKPSKPAARPTEAVSATAAGAEPQQEGQNTAEARLLYLQQGIDCLEAEATFIKEDKLRHHWNPADLHRWQEAVARLDSLRQEVAALTAGAPAVGTVQQEHSQAGSLTEEAGTPDTTPQVAVELTADSLEAGSNADQGQPDTMAAVRPAGTEAQGQADPEEALGSVAEKRPAETEAGTVQLAGILHVSPEVEQGPQPQPAGTGKTTSVDADSEDSDEDTQHDSMRGLWDASSEARLQSVQAGNLEDVDWLLADAPSCDVDVRDADRRTPLHIAAELGSLDIVNLLLSHKATHSVLDNKGRSPLYAAALAGHQNSVRTLLEAGADHGRAPSPLHSVRDPEVLAVLLEDGADPHKPDLSGETPLQAAFRCGHTEAAKTLLAYGAYKGMNYFESEILLRHAVEHGDADMVKLLLGLIMRDIDDWDRSPLVDAVKEGNARLTQAILKAAGYLADETLEAAMLAAAKLNHAECMSALMAANGEDDSPFDDSECIGLTPLMVSAAFGSFEVLKMLLAAGASVHNGSLHEGLTPLHLAAIFGNTEVAHALLKHGACTGTRDFSDHTAAELASIYGQHNLASALISASTDKENAGESYSIPLTMDKTHNDAGMPAAAGAQEQAELLDRAPDAQLTDGKPATAQPGCGALKPPSGEQMSQPEAAQAAVASAGIADIEAATEGGHPSDSEGLISGDPDDSNDMREGVQVPATGMQHAGPEECEDKDPNARALLDAVELGKLEDVERLLKAGCCVDIKDGFGYTPLHIATTWGDSDIVKLLLAHGAEPSRPFWNANMHPPLYEAALGGHQDIVKALLDAGADFGRAPSPLHNVSDPDVLGLLLEAGANVESVEWNGETPLVRAVCRGDFEAAETLLCVGARPTLDRFGYSPLMHAVKQGSADMVELLLRKGLCQDKALWTPLVYAVMEGNVWWMQRIVDSGRPEGNDLEMAMLAAAKCDHADCMSLLLTFAEGHYIDIDGQQCTGLTPLMVAAAFGSTKVLRLLLEAGADVDARNYLEGLTALHLAAIFGRTEAAHALLEHGAGTAIRDRDGHTAAKLATLFGQAAFVAALIPLPIAEDQPQAEEAAQTSGPDVDTEASSNGGQLTNVSEASHQGDQDSSISLDQGPHVPAGGMQHGGSGGSKYANSKALLQAARLGRSQDVERLLDAGCTVDIQDADGFTPIYHAAREGFKDTVELLLAHGANASSHPLPMYPAVLAGHRGVIKTLLAAGADLGAVGEIAALCFAEVPDPELLALLLGAGADVNAVTDKGQTPLVLALRYQCSEVVKTLLDYGACADMCDDLGRSPLKCSFHNVTIVFPHRPRHAIQELSATCLYTI